MKFLATCEANIAAHLASGLTVASVITALLAIGLSLARLEYSLAIICGLPVVAVLIYGWSFVEIFPWPGVMRPSWRVRMVALASVAVTISVIMTYWPLRLAFAFVRPQFETHATQVDQGRLPQRLTRLGVFPILEAGKNRSGGLYFWTDDDPTGYGGIVKCSDRLLNQKFNVWSSVSLGGGWYFIHED